MDIKKLFTPLVKMKNANISMNIKFGEPEAEEEWEPMGPTPMKKIPTFRH